MSDSKDHFERQLQKLFSSSNREPPRDVWNQIAKQLDQQDRQARIISLTKRWSAVAAVFLLLAGVGYWFVPKINFAPGSENPVANHQIDQNTVSEAHNLSQNKSEPPSKSTAQIRTVKQNKGLSSILDTLLLPNVDDFSNQINQTSNHLLLVDYQPETRPINTKHMYSIGNQAPFKIDTVQKSQTKLADSFAGEFEIIDWESHRNNRWLLAAAGNLNSGQKNSDNSAGQSNLTSQNFAMSSQSFSKDNRSSNKLEQTKQLLNKELGSMQILSQWSTGLLAGWNASNHITIQTGAMFQRTQFRQQLQYVVFNSDSKEFLSVFEVYQLQNSGSESTIWPLVDDSQTRTHNVSYIQIPIRVVVATGESRLQFGAMAGAALHLRVDQNQINSSNEISLDERYTPFSKQYASIQLGLSANYELGSRISIFLEPNFQQPITNQLKPNLPDTKLFSFGIQSGIVLHFK